jgi:hypothetical protein
MKMRLRVYSQVLSGELPVNAAAAQLGIGLADVQRGVEALEMARVMLAQDRAVRMRSWRRGIGAAGVLVAIAVTTWAVDPVWAQATCAQTLPSPLVTFCPDNPALASQVNGNFQGVAGWIAAKAGPVASPDITTRDIAARNVSVTGPMNFGTTTQQMLNLYQTGYGIGVQSSTLYSRTGGNFAWYLNGVHANGTLDSGGGTFMMALSGAGDLTVAANLWGPGGLYTNETTYSSNTGLVWNECPNGLYVCGIGTGHVANNNNYWTGARVALRCCAL